MNEDIQKIFEGMELNEDFKHKVEEIYEARINEEKEKIKEQAELEAEEKYSALAEEYGEYVVEAMESKMEEYLQEEVLPTIEKYLDHVATEFVNENKLVIESETKVELADQFLKGFSQIAEAYNVDVPAGQDDVVAKLKAQLEEANLQVEKLLDQNLQLKEEINESKKASIIEDVSEGMTETQKEKFVESCQKVVFHNEKQFKSAIAQLKESFVPSLDGQLNEQVEDLGEQTKDIEDPYLNSILSKL